MSDKGTDICSLLSVMLPLTVTFVSVTFPCEEPANIPPFFFNSLHIGSDSQVLYLSTVI